MSTSISQNQINVSPTSIMDQVEKVFYTKYTPKQWGQYVTQLLPKKTCGISWTNKRFAVNCETCQNDTNSCVCLKCFLNGKHEGHMISFRYSSNASCDCGDKQLWKEDGFCPKHPGCSEHPEKTDISEDLYQKYELTFQALIKVLPLSFDDDETNAAERIISFMLLHTSYGDAIRRCFTLAFARYADIPRIFDNIHKIGSSAQNFSTLISNVSNDPVFRKDIVPRLIYCLPIFVNRSVHINLEAQGDKKFPGVEALKEFSKCIFHWFSTSNIDTLCLKGVNWTQQAISILRAYCTLLMGAPNMNTVKNSKIADILSHFDSYIVPEENPDTIRDLALHVAERLVQVAGIRPFKRAMVIKLDDPAQIQSIVHNFEFTVGGFMHQLNSIPKAFSPKVFDVFANYIKNVQPDYSSVLSGSTEISLATAIYILLEIELKLSNDIPKWLDYMANIAGISRTELCSRIACMPIKQIAASRFSHFNKYVRNDDETFLSLISLTYKYNLQFRFAPLFALLQICAENTGDINRFMEDMAVAYGVVSIADPSERTFSHSIFLLDALFLVTDRACFTNDSGELLDMTVVALLKSGDKSYADIQSTLPNVKHVVTQVPLHINKLAKTITAGSRSLLTLKDSHPWSLGVPWIKTSYNYSILNVFSAQNKEIPFSFQLPDDDRKGLIKILSTPAVKYSAIYLTTSQNTADGQLLNGYLNALYQIEGYDANIVPSTETIRPDISSFDQNLTQLVINTYDIDQQIISLTSIAKTNPTTAALLAKFGLQIGDILDKEAQIKKNKERARAARERSLKSLNTNNMFIDMDVEDDEAEQQQVCSVCQEEGTEPLNIPVFVHISVIPSIIDKSIRVLNPDNSIRYEGYRVCTACQHICHSDCIMRNEGSVFICPLCRQLRNDMIPVCKIMNFDIDEVDLSIPIVGGQNSILNYSSFGVSRLIAASVTNLEARHRMNPGALDSSANSMLYKSLFAIAWKKAHIEDDDLEKFGNNKLCDLVMELAAQDKPGLEFTRIVSSICSSIKEKDEIYPFLRRAAILHALIFSLNKDQFFDWDDYLEYENLCQKFCIDPVEGVDVSVKPFKLIDLPQSPIDLYRPPFDEDLMPADSTVFYCLFDKYLLMRENDSLTTPLYSRYNCGVVPVIQLTNDRALSVKYASYEFQKFFEGPVVYYNLLGQPAIGLESSDILHLSQDKVTEIEDDLLSGNFTRNRK